MRMKTSTPHQRVWTVVLAGLSLLSLLVISACDSGQPGTETAGPADTETAPTVKSVAEDIAADVGKVMDVIEGNPDQTVFIFEETHVSPAGQIEIAIMLNRLYEKYGLRLIALEGALLENGSLDTTWFEPSFTAGQSIGPREDVVVGLLEEGEINSAEMMALVYADAEVAGVEGPEYLVELSEEAAGATTSYLFEIAVAGLTQSEIEEANDLIDQGKEDEAFEFIIGTDEFTKETSERLDDPSINISCEELVDLADEIETKAAEVEADITPEDEDNLDSLRTFYKTCVDRSGIIVDNTLALVQQFAGVPVAMMIGAAHTDRVKQLFADAGISLAVIRPNFMEQGRENGDLSYEAYDRKLAGLSVGSPGSLGALLDSRRKPPPVIGELWAQSEADLRLVTTKIARAAAQGQLPPFNDALKDVLPRLENVTIVPGTIQMIKNEVVFSVEALDNNSQPVVLWVRTIADKQLAKQTLNERLFEALSNVQEKDEPSDEPEPPESDPVLQRVSSDTIAIFSKDQSVILTMQISP